MIKPLRLKYKNFAGHGKEIYAEVDHSFNMVEFTTKKGYQPVCQPKTELIGYEPWVQFEPKEWTEMVNEIFKEMVDLWNGKHAIKD